MPNDSDLIKLYSGQILALAADIPHAGTLENAQASAKKRSPLCGSTVTAYVRTDADGRIVDFAQNVRACALGQASSSVLGRHVIGLNRAAIARGRAALEAMLKENGPTPPAPFEGLEVLRPARDFKNRHASILLAWDALLEALDNVQNAQTG